MIRARLKIVKKQIYCLEIKPHKDFEWNNILYKENNPVFESK